MTISKELYVLSSESGFSKIKFCIIWNKILGDRNLNVV